MNPYFIAGIAAVVFAAGAGSAWKLQDWRLGSQLAKSQGQLATIAETVRAQKEANRIKEEADQLNKEHTDAENERLRTDNSGLSKQLRAARASTSFTTQASPTAKGPGLACYDRPDLERTLQQLDAGVSGLIEEGGANAIDLNAAKAWARDQQAGR